MSKTWEKLSPHDRIVAVHVDVSNHKDFASLSGVVYVGDVKINDDIHRIASNYAICAYTSKVTKPYNIARSTSRW